jgi:hypothetical protein
VTARDRLTPRLFDYQGAVLLGLANAASCPVFAWAWWRFDFDRCRRSLRYEHA